MNGTEDSPISIYLSAYSVASSIGTSREITIRVINFPTGSTFNRGTFNGQFWTLSPTDFGELELHLPKHFSGIFEITAEALYSDVPRGRVGRVQVTVQPVPDIPSLRVTHSLCIESGQVEFTISTSLSDSDGSEALWVSVLGLPENSQLSAGHISMDGEYILELADLQGSIIATIPSTGNISITFIAMATEMLNNSTASTNVTISLSKCQEGTLDNLP